MNDQQHADLDIALAAAGTDPDLVAAAVSTMPDQPSKSSRSRTAFDIGLIIGLVLALVVLVLSAGCQPSPQAPKREADARQVKPEPVLVKQPPIRQEHHFKDDEMVIPLNQLAEYRIEDYHTLPNCLTILRECTAVPFEGKTSEQYKDSVQAIAKKPCRVVLKVVEISADYDSAEFDILTDDGESGLAALKQAGDLDDYNKNLRIPLAVNRPKEKGLGKHSIGDRVVLVGLGYVVPASPWGAASPRHGMPRGDERQVMLRAFGKPTKHHPPQYEFGFMVRNWYIAEQ